MICSKSRAKKCMNYHLEFVEICRLSNNSLNAIRRLLRCVINILEPVVDHVLPTYIINNNDTFIMQRI